MSATLKKKTSTKETQCLISKEKQTNNLKACTDFRNFKT